jgi:hypothetical protein
LKEGNGTDPGLPSPAIGAHLFQIMDSLPNTDVEFGAILSIGYTTNGTRDEILYQQHTRPQIYFPLHMTDVELVGSSLEFKVNYQQTIFDAIQQASNNVTYAPEARWWVDPDDFMRPQVFNSNDPRWSSKTKDKRIGSFGACS